MAGTRVTHELPAGLGLRKRTTVSSTVMAGRVGFLGLDVSTRCALRETGRISP
jgi:hypothetical protein